MSELLQKINEASRDSLLDDVRRNDPVILELRTQKLFI